MEVNFAVKNTNSNIAINITLLTVRKECLTILSIDLNLIQCKIDYTSSLDKNTPVPLGLYSWLGHSVQSHPVLSLSNTFVQCNQLHLLLRDQLGSSNRSNLSSIKHKDKGARNETLNLSQIKKKVRHPLKFVRAEEKTSPLMP